MKNEKFIIEDGSGDKEFFTIIPNYILNHSSVYDRCVYIQIKRTAGEDREFWQSVSTIAKITKMSESQVRKSLKYLTANKWISKIGTRSVSGGLVNVYKCNNLWHANSDYYRKQLGGHQVLGVVAEVDTRKQSGGHQVHPNKINITRSLNNIYIESELQNTSGEEDIKPFNQNKVIESLLASKYRPLQITGLWIKIHKFNFQNYKQLESEIKRCKGAASMLEGYSNKQITDVYNSLSDKKITLFSIANNINDINLQKTDPSIARLKKVLLNAKK